MVFHDKTKRVVNFILPNLHELRNKTKAKILDLNHCEGKIHLEVSVGNRIYKNRENVL